jgi:hypothetical protein
MGLGLLEMGGLGHAKSEDAVSWSIGTEASSLDGGALKGPVTFTWTFNRPVKHGRYLDGTPWVLWEQGLQLVAVSPSVKTESLPDHGEGEVSPWIVDATCINLGQNNVPLDQRIGNTEGAAVFWNEGKEVWNGKPAQLSPGDCIVTAQGRRDERKAYRAMLFNAIGVCNIVKQDMTGRFRPPLRMPPELRAKLMTPEEVSVQKLPVFPDFKAVDWTGNAVELDFSQAVKPMDADDLMNGPMGNCGIKGHIGYEPANGKLNHHLSGLEDAGYQRDVAVRLAVCLYTAFNGKVDMAKRQRSLNKFIQAGLDYYHMHCLGYAVWNGGGGHPNGIEGAITLSGAILGRADMTDAIKLQRFLGDAVGDQGKTYDMMAATWENFARSEALYTVSVAPWQSGKYLPRKAPQDASKWEDGVAHIDMAREDMVLNNRSVPYTEIKTVDRFSHVLIDPEFVWPMFSRNRATEARRSHLFMVGAVMRFEGDKTIRKVMDFKTSDGEGWTDGSWFNAKGQGGILVVYPPLQPDELKQIRSAGNLTTGVCTKREAENDEVVLWESWPVTSEDQVTTGFFASPIQDYLDIKVGDLVLWLPFYSILDDPGATGKKLHEESLTHRQITHFLEMQRKFGSHFWDRMVSGANFPKSPTIQALSRHYLLQGRMAEELCKKYDSTEQMWVDGSGTR